MLHLDPLKYLYYEYCKAVVHQKHIMEKMDMKMFFLWNANRKKRIN